MTTSSSNPLHLLWMEICTFDVYLSYEIIGKRCHNFPQHSFGVELRSLIFFVLDKRYFSAFSCWFNLFNNVQANGFWWIVYFVDLVMIRYLWVWRELEFPRWQRSCRMLPPTKMENLKNRKIEKWQKDAVWGNCFISNKTLHKNTFAQINFKLVLRYQYRFFSPPVFLFAGKCSFPFYFS